jgi:F0F1-type ATP synthase delta subunit
MSSEIDVDCTSYCRLVSHGNALTKCLTKREISEEKLISYLTNICGNYKTNLDENVM